MSEVNEILKKVTASIEDATSKFNAKAEEALTEAKKNGQLSAQTKDVVDKMATELNALKEAEKTLKASLGELEQHVAQMPLNNAAKVTETVGQVVINSEALKAFAASVEGNKRVSVPVHAALLSTDVADGVVEPQRLPGIDTAPKQRLFIRDLIARLAAHLHRLFSGCSKRALPMQRKSLQRGLPNLTAILNSRLKSRR